MVVARVPAWEGARDGGALQQADLRAGDYGITFLFTSRRANWKWHEVLNSESSEFLCAISGCLNPEKGAGHRTKPSTSNPASSAKESGPALILPHFSTGLGIWALPLGCPLLALCWQQGPC